MLKVYMLIKEVSEDGRVLERLREQGVSTDDWDIILILPRCYVNDTLVSQFVRNEDGKLVCHEHQLDKLVDDGCGESVWYDNIEVCDDTCWVGVKYH